MKNPMIYRVRIRKNQGESFKECRNLEIEGNVEMLKTEIVKRIAKDVWGWRKASGQWKMKYQQGSGRPCLDLAVWSRKPRAETSWNQ